MSEKNLPVQLQGDQLDVAVFFWYLVKHTLEFLHQKKHFHVLLVTLYLFVGRQLEAGCEVDVAPLPQGFDHVPEPRGSGQDLQPLRNILWTIQLVDLQGRLTFFAVKSTEMLIRLGYFKELSDMDSLILY